MGGVIPKSTQWARNNRDRVKLRDQQKKGTLDGKLISLVVQSRYRAKQKDWSHNIDTKYLRGLYLGQGGCCALTGKKMSIRGARGTEVYWNSISLDRIDSNLGYIDGNVQLVCVGVNYMKKDMSDKQFIDFCMAVSEYN